MSSKTLYRIINEEISKYDYLNNDKYQEKEMEDNLIKDASFQKKFIIDSITQQKLYIEKDITNFEIYKNSETNNLVFECFIDINYKYNDNEIPFNLKFGDLNTDLDINNISNLPVFLYNTEGDNFEFKAYKEANDEIKTLFIKSYIADVLNDTNPDDIENAEEPYNTPPIY